jgi:hypothetical protein
MTDLKPDPRLKFVWTHDQRTDTDVFGTDVHGGGVYQESGACEYFGNSVVSGKDVVSMGPFQTSIDAKLAVEADFIKRSSEE